MRKNRNKKRDKNNDARSKIGIGLIIKKNLAPVSVLVLGCIIFVNSLNIDTRSAEQRYDYPPYLERLAHKEQQAKKKKTEPKQQSIRIQPIARQFLADSNISTLDFLETELLDSNEFAWDLSTEHKNSTGTISSEAPKLSSSSPIKVKSLPSPQKKITVGTKSFDFPETTSLRPEIEKIIKNTPMMAMLDYIMERDPEVATFLVSIAMKESKFGIYSPKKDGKDCFNYWGYRGRENQTKSGYSCFDSPEHAIKVVGDRIESFISRGLDTPAELIIWKCGYSCAGHSPESVDKWIADVDINFRRLGKVSLAAKK